jgi:diguanylate cyclase (GGDEF)-like protein
MAPFEANPKARILLVDDSVERVRVLNDALQGEHELVFAMSGDKALEIARSQELDLILLDARMPGMDGFAVCAALKASPQTREIPVIFVTALMGPEDETRALEAGAVDFITKPVNCLVVRARVKTHLTLKRQADILRSMSMRDWLTGIANRRCLDETMEAQWRQCQRAHEPCSFALVDIDHFKIYNDQYGHPEGDRCLFRVAQAIQGCVARPRDLVARYGGEEFAILLPCEDLDGAETVAQRVIEAVRALEIPHAYSPIAPFITVSVGVSSAQPGRSTSIQALVDAADTKLYEAKNAGRNRYRH